MQSQFPTRSVFLAALLVLSASFNSAGGGLLQEVFTDIPGSAVADLTNSVKFPDRPDSTNILLEFEAPIDVGQDYGQRVRGYVIAPATGDYVFWIASDDASVLYLSTDESPANVVEIASVPGWTPSRQWDWYAEQQSTPIRLEASQPYYVEALMKQGGGGDNLAVRWQLPDATIEEPIPEIRLLPFGTAFSLPAITNQPSNLTVTEDSPATFTVLVSNLDPVSYQWLRNGTNIAGATGFSYTIPAVTLADNRARFRCRLANAIGSVLSAEAVLTVLPDQQPPTLVAVQNFGRSVLTVTFSELVEAASATNKANYSVDGGVTVSSAALSPDGKSVILGTSDLVYDMTYTLTVNRVRDRAATPNTIAPDSKLTFLVLEFVPIDIGKPSPPGSSTPVSGGLDLVGGGTGLGSFADQFFFNYQQKTGDFDTRVLLQSLELSDVWAMAGLMARQSPATNSPYAAILGTPSISGINFLSRVTTNATSMTGSFPVNYPWTWLRLKRAGNVFTGYASFDGQAWTQVGSVTNPLPATIYFGMAVSSHGAGLTAQARFLDMGDVVAPVTSDSQFGIEPLGPSSRRSGLILSEIMYHPALRADGKELEFVELFNTLPTPEDISGYRLSGSLDYTFPAHTIMPAGGFLVVAMAPADVQSVYGLSHVLGGYTNALPHDNGTIRLQDNLSGVLLEVSYSDQPPWPLAADGAGHSLVLARPSYGEGNPAAWAASQLKGGSPGAMDAIRPDPLTSVVINELLIHTDAPLRDFVELYNHSNQTLDLSGAYLTDDPITNKFRVPAGTMIAPRGFVVFGQDQIGFNLSSAGEAIYLLSADQSRVIDAVRFGPQENGVSFGRFPDGAPSFHELQTLTPGAPNAGLLIRDVVINEIMYHPISEDDADQYVELFNRGTNPVNVGYWRFIAGISFTFPPNAVIPAGGYVVVAQNAAHLMTNYAQLTAANTFGDFGGRLSHAGERLALARPSDPAQPLQDFVVVDEVTYQDGGRWGAWSDGGGSSLELIDAHSDHRLAPNWGDSDESAKAPWSTVEATGVLDNGNNTYGIDALQIMLMGAGECLVDEVEVIGPNGANLVSNSSFEEGIMGWTAAGNHGRSSWESTGGYGSTGSLHLRASGAGETDANQVRTKLLAPLSPGMAVTLRAKVRWLRGSSEILLRVRGNYLEAAGKMALPPNLGSPGAPNSRAVDNAGPAIVAVQHHPALPAINQPVLVTARVHDPDGIAIVRLKYRVDPSSVTNTVMVDDGTGGDIVAGDGIYSAMIPGQPTTNLVAFFVQAYDDSPAHAMSTFPNDAPDRECLVRWGETVPTGNYGVYRFWITKNTLDQWSSGPPSSSDPLDATFVYGNYRVVYNIGASYAGSPFHWTGYNGPIGNNCSYGLNFPADDQLLGNTGFVLKLPANQGSDPAVQREQAFHWMAKQMGLPYAYRRFLRLFVNGRQRGAIYEDTQRPNGDFIKEWFPNDAEGDLYKVDDWFEYDDNAFGFVNTDATLDDFRDADGQKKTARYRWNWRKKALKGSAHDYRDLFALVDALNTMDSETYTAQVEALVDVEQWMRIFASRHIVGDWDAYGYRRGKNMNAYKPQQGKWQLLNDDISFDYGLGDGPTESLFDDAHFDGSIDRVSERMYNHPPFRRTYLRLLQDAANGPLLSTNIGPILDAKYAALTANGITVGKPSSIKTWIESRRTYIRKVLAGYAAAFAITSNGGTDFSIADQNLLTLSGTAPVGIKTLRLNGVAYPVVWTTVTNWTLRLPLKSGMNALTVQGFDSYDKPDPRAASQIKVTFTGADQQPQDHLVINEIMYHPSTPDSGFVELYNTSTSYAFDLSGYRLDGVGFTFPAGTLIGPGAYLVVVNSRAAFTAVYGNGVPIAGEFPGRLRNDGETLSLMKPGLSSAQDLVVNQVTYSDQLPWPAAADGQGASLQLIDPNQDNRRVADWTAVGGSGEGGGWELASVTGIAIAQSMSLVVYLQSSGDVYLDYIWLTAGTSPQAGTNLVNNGDFEMPLGGSWTVSEFDPETATTNTVKHSGKASLHLVSTTGGSAFPTITQTIAPLTLGRTYTLSFWYLPGPTGGGLTVGLRGSDIQKTVSILPGQVLPLAPATPGAPNSVATNLAPFPDLWINEVQPNNVSGKADQSGVKAPWIELFNAGSTPVSLGGLYLTDNLTNLLQWPFPADVTIAPGGFLVVWADGQPDQSQPSELHTSFGLNPVTGTVALVQKLNEQPGVLDYLSYQQVPADGSVGSYPDGDPNARQVFFYPTPGAANNPAAAPVKVLINEWMASNRSVLPNPVDGQFDDWLELFNPNESPVDLSGYTLTDDLNRPALWAVPPGTIIAARGFLLVWADNNSAHTGPGTGLHTNFKLNQDGEAIGLFAPDGTQVDAITFGPQTPDVSEGRFPDGAAPPFVAMPTATPGAPNVFTTAQPKVIGLTLSANGLAITWSVASGKTYQVQYKDDLNDLQWQVLGAEQTPAGSTLSVTDVSALTNPQRYYRLLLLP